MGRHFHIGMEEDGTPKHFIVLPRAVAAARLHYGCASLEKVPLEEAGGDGSAFSHWDERAMHSDLMTPQLSLSPVISNITLALLEDSGWYKPVYAMAGSFEYGQKKGCPFLSEKCINAENASTRFPDTFCIASSPNSCNSGRFPETRGCTHDLMGKAICDSCIHEEPLAKKFQYFPNSPRLGGRGFFRGFCPMWVPYMSSNCGRAPTSGNSAAAYGESFGASSRCILSTVIARRYSYGALDRLAGSCRQTECQADGINIRIDDKWIFCGIADEGKQVQVGIGWYGHVVCPSHSSICGRYGSQALAEHSKCLFPSTWRHGRCVCAAGYLNEDCAVEDTSENRKKYPYDLQYGLDELIIGVGESVPQILQEIPGISGNIAGLSFSVTPPLPQGLSLTASSGVIAGSATAAAGRAPHTIRAAGSLGAATATLFITVDCAVGDPACARPAVSTPAPASSPPASTAHPGNSAVPTLLPTTSPGTVSTDSKSSTTVVVTTTSDTGGVTSRAEQTETLAEAPLFEQTWFMIAVLAGLVLSVGCCCFVIVCACCCKRKESSLPIARATQCTRATKGRGKRPAPKRAAARSPSVRVLDDVRTVQLQPETRNSGVVPGQDDMVAQMADMGFDFEIALAALEDNSWNVNRAVAAVS